MAHIALAFNLVHPGMLGDRPFDTIAELDNETTIQALDDAIRTGGHSVTWIEADEDLYEKLRAANPDLVFNIVEGLRGESRESHLPAICEHLGIPYTGSGVLTTATCLNKARTKEILSFHGLHTPRFQVFAGAAGAVNPMLRYPLIVKLVHEGSSMGLTMDSIIDDEASLRRRVEYLTQTYQQEALVEEFIQGREFTVGILGNQRLLVLPIVELTFDHPRGINMFQPDDPVIAMAIEAMGRPPALDTTGHGSIIDAEAGTELGKRIIATATRAYRALDCRDWCRMEMRLGPDGELYLLELNPIAGIDPSYLLPRSAAAAGYSYAQFVNLILDFALERVQTGK